MIYAMHAINLWHAINHWCNRGSIRSLECSDSLQLVATWCKTVEMIGDSDGDIMIHSVMHSLIIKSLLNSFIKVLLRLLTCHILNVIIIAGALPSLDCGTVLFNWAGRIWCKMATMIVMIMAMVVIMLAMVVIMMVMVNVTPSFVDAFCIWLDHSCYVKHVHLLHVWFHHYCRVIAIAGTGWITRIAMRTT